MSRRVLSVFALALLIAACGKKDSGDKSGPPAPAPDKGGQAAVSGDFASLVAELSAKIGVDPGAITYDSDRGADAVLAADRQGAVAIRRAGAEAFEDAAAGDVDLYAGDQVRTADGGAATVVLADESTVELAEDAAVAIGDRDASADPASSAAVLAGVARFTVSPRGAGEGPFVVHAPGGMVAAKGTVFAVGVAATGVARVGVEEGEVEVAGRADLAAPVAVAAGNAATIALDGSLGDNATFASDDWGDWRDGVEADVAPEAVVQAQVDWLAELDKLLGDAYIDLEGLTGSVDAEVATATKAEQADDPAAYQEVAEPLATDVEASYLASLRLENLSFAALSSAYLVAEVNARHPEKTEKIVVAGRPHIWGALLWHKKFHVIVNQHVRPLRAVYYVHHPVGRAHAAAASEKVPAFYARVKLAPLDPVKVRGRVKVAVFVPPAVVKVSARKRVWVTVPAPGWNAKVKAHPGKPRGAAWYVRASAPRATVLVGAKVVVKAPRVFVDAKPAPMGKVVVKWRGGAVIETRKRGKLPGAEGGVRAQGAGGSVGVAVPPVPPPGKPGARVDVKGGVVVKPGGAGGAVVVKPGAAGGGVVVKPGGAGGAVVVKPGAAGGGVVVKKPGAGVKVDVKGKVGVGVGAKKKP